MNGVEILVSNEVVVAWETWSWSGFWCTVGLGAIAALFVSVCFGISKLSLKAGLLLFVVLLLVNSATFGLLIGFNTGKPIAYETHYKVTIDDSVSMNEFLDKYEILDQEGKIYTVKEK